MSISRSVQRDIGSRSVQRDVGTRTQKKVLMTILREAAIPNVFAKGRPCILLILPQHSPRDTVPHWLSADGTVCLSHLKKNEKRVGENTPYNFCCVYKWHMHYVSLTINNISNFCSPNIHSLTNLCILSYICIQVNAVKYL